MSLSEDEKRWIRAEMQAGLGEFHAELQAGLMRQFRAELERVETTLLTEFHKWDSPVEMRQYSHSAAIRAMDTEIEALSERVTKLEAP